jgi:transcriptional regulator with XRE-family HTH domain
MSAETLGKFCDACQAIPSVGYCRLAGCPNRPSSDEGPCTDCGGTGIAYQTERPCACQAASRTLSKPQQVFAQRLRIAREGLEMSQEELSRRSALPASAISHYESGRRSPSLDNLVRIIRAMPGVNANWLLGLTGDKTTDQYEDGYSDALADAQAALLELEQRQLKDQTHG